ncbi:hypothetical protein TVAG_429450 [Trichomonas vaginalis G3]|uniref:Dynactin subunit 6 n=1 Tax=Trichomonas vaginalis (strain ATCC PRA-98 / G3) TaxID=412133 RepID=A2FC52_TRIV3|nr:trimeric LpxA-like superfamily [Trichomonas vaginalis G3]EAX97509.1 hypothetical protein TVAG_429450 [Trichomonas vaginalis G3]KAI5505531.1 trimeric LpxA-like superfamily [Trichomonas vaginalis G3]|eukprot:XP_001310439.1 hypothetical protein [Trichomonas vaginalis G3]
MNCAIALDNSVVTENTYIPSYTFVAPAAERFISSSANIDSPICIGRGVTIYDNAVICYNVTLSDGYSIQEGVVIGNG